MFRNHIKRSSVCLVLTLLFSWNVAGESPEAEAPQLPKLPAPVWQALEHGHQGDIFLKADFQQLQGLPEVEVFAREKEFLNPRSIPFLDGPISAATILEPVADSIGIIWDSGHGRSLYAECSLSPSEIISTCRSYGWTLIETDGLSYLRQPLDEADEKEIQEHVESDKKDQKMMRNNLEKMKETQEEGDPEFLPAEDWEPLDDEALIEKARKEIEERKWKIFPGAEGWIELVPPWTEPQPFTVTEAPENFTTRAEDFPFNAFFDQDRADLCLIGMIFPPSKSQLQDREKKEAGDRGEEILAEMEAIRHEMDRLSGRSMEDLSKRIGNMLLAINETDGGLDLDLRAEVRGTPDENLTAEIVQMALSGLRISIIERSPELARELFDTTISSSADQIHGMAKLSHLTLVEYLEKSAQTRQRMKELSMRLVELQRELMTLSRSESSDKESSPIY